MFLSLRRTFWYASVTYLIQSVTLTLGDVRSRLRSILSGGHNITIWLDPLLRLKDNGGKISALSQIAKKWLTKALTKLTSQKTEHFLFDLTWKVTQIGQLAHHLIRNVPGYPLIFVAKFYHTQERDGARGGLATPPPLGVFSFGEKGGAGEGEKMQHNT